MIPRELERQAYLKGLTRFLGGLEDARVALALACQRLDGEAQRSA